MLYQLIYLALYYEMLYYIIDELCDRSFEMLFLYHITGGR